MRWTCSTSYLEIMARVERTRNGGKWTEAQYWGRVRSALRKAFAAWEPANQTLRRARRPYRGPNRRQKWEVQCNACEKWFPMARMCRDHIVPAGSLKRPEDLAGFLERLTPEDPAAFQMLCDGCHKLKTQEDRAKLRK